MSLLGTSKSLNGIKIRLTRERLDHIVSSHKELESVNHLEILAAIEDPDLVLEGWSDELLAVRKIHGRRLWLVVIYKEEKQDGFVITAYITTDLKWLLKRKVIWNKK